MSDLDQAKRFAAAAMEATGGRGVERYDPNAIVHLCAKCRQPIEAERLAWHAPTCSGCSAEGCGVPWLHGAPIRRCDNCDCMPPLEHEFGEQLRALGADPDPPAMFHVERPIERIRGTLRIRL